jgi:CYTH domain-containing protein
MEIEKKYLISENGIDYGLMGIGDSLFKAVIGEEIAAEDDSAQRNRTLIRQGYMSIEHGKTLAQRLGLETDFEIAEARLRAKGTRYFFTLKGEGTLSREEQEREIDEGVFQENWPLTEGRRIEKIRLEIPYEGLTAEIDLYRDRDLITAEVECPDVETAQRLIPLGKDITEDKRYKNKNLAR